MFHPKAFCWALSILDGALAAVTVYGQIPFGQTTSAAPGAVQTVLAAYNDTVLNPPPLPDPLPATQFTLELPTAASNMPDLSIPQSGSFYGFSIEMSVATQILGKNSSFVQVPFLNLMANIAQRAGAVHVRTGGNTQDYAFFVDEIPDSFGKVIGKMKDPNVKNNPTDTPTLMFNMDYFYLLSNISSLVNVRWYLGIPFNDTKNFRLEVAEYSEAILGDYLLGLQIGNEPDLYLAHQHRVAPYGPFDYFGEVGDLINLLATNDKIPVKNNLIGPSVQGVWTPEQVWDTGFITTYASSLKALSVEKYPDDNCFPIWGIGTYHDPQTEFANYLKHDQGKNTVAPYLNSSAIAVAAGKPLLMFETNSAACGGFPGISDSFGAALWALDYGLTMAYSNFSGALLHVGGQNVFYNPFTAPPTNQTKFHQWTVGAVYYSALIVAEVFGSSNTSRIVDLNSNNSTYTPGYAIYEHDTLAKVALMNFMDDPSGANSYNATIHLNGGSVPSQVNVKYFLSPSVSTKDQITWAGQTLGTKFTVDGRLKGTLNITQIPCDTTANTCTIRVPAPGFALVFLSDDVFTEASPSSEMTFPTTAWTNTRNTATMDPSIVASSNGHSGKDREEWLGSTSYGKEESRGTMVMVSLTALLIPLTSLWIWLGRHSLRL